jgi:hypothetical protein
MDGQHMEAVVKTIGLMMPVLLLTVVIGAAHAQTTVQVEKLEPVRCTQGTTGPVNMVEAGFGEPGVFGEDVVVHWFGMETEGAVLEFRIPVAAPGPQRVVVGLARSWDYGVYQLMINGVDAGEPMDLASGAEPELVFPTEVDLGIHDLQSGGLLLGLRFVGESPRAKPGPNPGSVGIDYVRLLPAATGGGQGGLTFEVEKLQILKTGEGATAAVDLVEAGLATAKEFGANAVLHWFGMENPGAVLEFRVPVAAAGRYHVTVGVAKSWDYGLYQCRLNGKDAGPRLDLASGKEPEHVYPLAIDLGTYDLKRPQLTLGFRFEGASPNAQDGPNPMSGGFDWVRLTPAVGKPGPKTR